MNHKHKYRKFNDHQLFCSRCGEIKNVAFSYPWYYRPYTPYVQPYPYWTWSTGGTVSGSTTVNTGWVDTANTTYTLGDVTLSDSMQTVTKDAKPETPKTPSEKKIKGVADPDVKK